jgi:uncharacterized protein (TIGR02145 family)
MNKKMNTISAVLIVTIINLLLSSSVIAQTPLKMSYQAVIRNSSNQLVTDTQIGMQISILQGAVDGPAVYVETHTPTTNANGLASIEIGNGTVVSGGITSINWGNNTYFIKTETAVEAPLTTYTITGTSQLLSVPYALHAKTAETVTGGITETDPIFSAWDKDYNDLINTPTLFDGQYSSLSGAPSLFSGSFTDLTDIPTTIAGYGITDAFDGQYSSLSGAPSLFSGSFTDLTDIPTTIAGYGITDAFDGDYNSLTNLPTLFDGDWSSLTGTPPNVSIFNNDAGYLTDFSETQNLSDVLTESNDGGANQIKNIADPTENQDAATKAYVDLLETRIFELEVANGTATVTDIDGNNYPVVKIGDQIWMAEDLRVTTYPNGTPIPHVTDNTAWANLADDNTSDAYCFYNNDNTTDYGALYTYAAAIGVCPDGWHLPTDTEWTELTDYLGGTSVAGGKMKETGTSHWNSPNTGATNESGFSAIPGGIRSGFDGTFSQLGNYSYWWSATVFSFMHAWERFLKYENAEAFRGNDNKSFGFYVRCVRD